MALLEVQELSVRLAGAGGAGRAVRDLSLAIDKGATLGIVGESGCGKSMTALAIMGLLPDNATTSGRIVFDGTDLLALPEERLCEVRGNRIAMVFQEPMTSLNPVQPIGRQVSEALRLHRGLGRAARAGRKRWRCSTASASRSPSAASTTTRTSSRADSASG